MPDWNFSEYEVDIKNKTYHIVATNDMWSRLAWEKFPKVVSGQFQDI